MNYATVQDVTTLFRSLTTSEQTKAAAYIPIVSSALREEARKVGKNLDNMVFDNPDTLNVAKEITVRAVASAISTKTTDDGDISQFSQSALGYSVSGTYANPGGGIYFKTSELKRLGLKRQRMGAVEIYGN